MVYSDLGRLGLGPSFSSWDVLGRKEPGGEPPATAATALHRLFGSFSFFGKGCRDPLLLLPGPSFCVLAERRQREQPLQAACGGASRWPSRIGQRPPNVAGGTAGGGIRPAAVANLR